MACLVRYVDVSVARAEMLRRSIGSHGFIEFWRGSKIFLREPESSRGLKICRWSKP